MNLKSLLIGSATAMVLTSGAQAADAIVYADPEPMEYVRICDVYGAGFYYIPGTETCMKLGGYVRFEGRSVDYPVGNPSSWTGYSTFTRLALQPDVRTETEWGTLRAYSDTYINYDSTLPGTQIDMEAAFIELISGTGTLRIGKSDTPYSRWLGYGGLNVIDTWWYPYANSNEISYTYAGPGGFSAFLALVDNANDDTWKTNVEGGLLLSQGWGSIGAMVGYDAPSSTWGASAALTGNFGAASAKLQVFYSDDLAGAGYYQIFTPGGGNARWEILGSVSGQFTEKVGAALTAKWFSNDTWAAWAELQFTPVENLQIVPAVSYANAGGTGAWGGVIRVQRSW